MAKPPFNILSTKFLLPEVTSTARKDDFWILQLPFIETSLIEDADLGDLIKSLKDKKVGAIFTSANAVNAVKAYLPEPPDWQIYCINGATHEAVRNYFPACSQIISAPDAGKLSELIKENFEQQELCYFCGNRRLNIIPDYLNKSEINWREITVYNTSLTGHKVQEKFDGILFFSPSAVESFFNSNVIATGTICFAFGPSTYKKLRELTNNIIIQNNKPDQFSMIGELKKYFKNE